jgi:hypothetical protein
MKKRYSQSNQHYQTDQPSAVGDDDDVSSAGIQLYKNDYSNVASKTHYDVMIVK